MIILASQSPRRKELLSEILSDFIIQPADIDETVALNEQPTAYVMRMAQEKAATIAKNAKDALVIASDTTVVAEGEILGKPENRADAYRMLKQMSGKTHQVYTAVVMQQNQQKEELLATAKVTFYPLTDEEIHQYLDKNDYQDKAGAYGIQGAAKVFVKSITGDYYSIVGFPIGAVKQLLRKFQTKYLSSKK